MKFFAKIVNGFQPLKLFSQKAPAWTWITDWVHWVLNTTLAMTFYLHLVSILVVYTALVSGILRSSRFHGLRMALIVAHREKYVGIYSRGCNFFYS